MEKQNKVSDKKGQIVRLDEEDLEYIFQKGNHKSFNDGIRTVVQALRGIEAQGLTELIGYFSEKEWLYMANVLKRTDLFFDKNLLILRLADPIQSVALAPMYDIELDELSKKIQVLGAHHVLALVERINGYWKNDGVDISIWANF